MQDDQVSPARPREGLGVLVMPAIRDREAPAGLGDIPYRPARPPARVEGELAAGESLTGALVARGVPATSVRQPVAALQTLFDFRRSQPGHLYEADLDDEGRILRLRYQTRPETIFEARRSADGYEANPVAVHFDITTHQLAGTVTTTFIGAVTTAGEGEALAQRMVDIFQWDLDFSRQVRPGDAFRLVYEKVHLDGRFLRYGRVLAAEYIGSRAQAVAWLFENEDIDGYYDDDGRPLQRMFLVAPCRYNRISSRFDLNRLHPVLGVRRPHLGVDYAAPTGTPVMAVADGTVSFVGVRGGNGNLVTIRHAHGYETGYAHLHRFARGLRAGDRVRQGQVIGQVGSTGLSTGAHLHFGLKHRGRYIDPLGDHDARGPGLQGSQLRAFQRRRAELRVQLDAITIAAVPGAAVDDEDEGSDAFNEGEHVVEF